MVRMTLGLAMIAALAAPAAAQTGRISGVLTDPSGAVLPGVQVRATLRDQNGETARTVVTDARGSYQLEALTPGQWAVSASLPGFEIATRQQAVQIGDTFDWSPRLEIGSVQETVTITTAATNQPVRQEKARPQAAVPAPAPAAPRVAQPGQPQPVRVGGNLKPPRKLVNVNPVYPSDAAAQGIGGVVILKGTIGVDGTVHDVETLRSPNDSLTLSATNALSGWEFTPALLNGQPVAVRMTATFNYTAK